MSSTILAESDKTVVVEGGIIELTIGLNLNSVAQAITTFLLTQSTSQTSKTQAPTRM